jgi:hypothetical protein
VARSLTSSSKGVTEEEPHVGVLLFFNHTLLSRKVSPHRSLAQIPDCYEGAVWSERHNVKYICTEIITSMSILRFWLFVVRCSSLNSSNFTATEMARPGQTSYPRGRKMDQGPAHRYRQGRHPGTKRGQVVGCPLTVRVLNP